MSHVVLYMFQCCSLKSFHHHLLPESKSLFFTSVSPLPPCTQDCWYHLSKCHLYVFIHSICLSDLLHSVKYSPIKINKLIKKNQTLPDQVHWARCSVSKMLTCRGLHWGFVHKAVKKEQVSDLPPRRPEAQGILRIRQRRSVRCGKCGERWLGEGVVITVVLCRCN